MLSRGLPRAMAKMRALTSAEIAHVAEDRSEQRLGFRRVERLQFDRFADVEQHAERAVAALARSWASTAAATSRRSPARCASRTSRLAEASSISCTSSTAITSGRARASRASQRLIADCGRATASSSAAEAAELRAADSRRRTPNSSASTSRSPARGATRPPAAPRAVARPAPCARRKVRRRTRGAAHAQHGRAQRLRFQRAGVQHARAADAGARPSSKQRAAPARARAPHALRGTPRIAASRPTSIGVDEVRLRHAASARRARSRRSRPGAGITSNAVRGR